jgi:2'-5' RNA ligase
MKLFRSFIAFQLPDKAKRFCLSIKKDLISKNLKAKWVNAENWHITVIFLGNHSLEELLSIAESIDSLRIDLDNICFNVSSLKTFDSPPKVLCLQLSDTNKTATKVIGHILSGNSLRQSHSEWIPHITLARFKTYLEKKSWRKPCFSEGISSFRFSPESLSVFISTLTPTGPIYNKINKQKL